MDAISFESRDLDNIRPYGKVCLYKQGEIVFSEGDCADHVYFIETGEVSIFLYEFTNRVEIGQRTAGSIFGEMAVINQGKRAASVCAITDTTLIVLDKDCFLSLMSSDSLVSEKISHLIAQRTEELALKENLLATTGVKGNRLQISIKGDPTLRESAFDRERRESPMDKVLHELIPNLQALLLERCVSEISLQFNSGEIHLTSIFDPFNYEIHPANKLIDTNYLNRHFPVLDYSEKTRLIHCLYGTIAAELNNLALPVSYKESYKQHYKSWQSLEKEEIVRVLDKLQTLRTIPNFYLRNMGISITRDAIRMQFNCDGTHIVSTGDYERFLEENIGV